jgi:uncharacterized Zn finger protein (UPF0148 family)
MCYYWWCNVCGKNVDVLVAYGKGTLYCINCGVQVVKPKNKTEEIVFIEYIEETEEIDHEEEEEIKRKLKNE